MRRFGAFYRHNDLQKINGFHCMTKEAPHRLVGFIFLWIYNPNGKPKNSSVWSGLMGPSNNGNAQNIVPYSVLYSVLLVAYKNVDFSPLFRTW